MADILTTILDLENGSLGGSIDAYRLEIHKEGEPRSKQHSLEEITTVIISALGDLTGAPGTPGTNGLTPWFYFGTPLEPNPTQVIGTPLVGIEANGDVKFTTSNGTEDAPPSVTWEDVGVNLKGPAGKSAYQVAVDNGFEGDEAAWLASLVGGGIPYDDTFVVKYWPEWAPEGSYDITNIVVIGEGDELWMYHILSGPSEVGVPPSTESGWIRLGITNLDIANVSIDPASGIVGTDFDTSSFPNFLSDVCARIIALEALHAGSFSGGSDPDAGYTVIQGHLQ